MRDPLRVGAVAYLNSRPLVHGLERSAAFDLSFDVPARLAERMRGGELDVALLPVIELARIPDLEIVPGLGIVTRGPARSVLLVARGPLERLRRVALDPESRTSNALFGVLCSHVWGIAPARVEPRRAEPAGALADALADCDAAVRIGDKALFEAPPAGCELQDLGEVWTRATGLPFVWAAWIARRGVLDRRSYRLLHDARRRGVRAIGEIAESYSWRGVRDPALARTYLDSHIRYRLGAAELAGLERFFELAAAAALIPSRPTLRMALGPAGSEAARAERLEESLR